MCRLDLPEILALDYRQRSSVMKRLSKSMRWHLLPAVIKDLRQSKITEKQDGRHAFQNTSFVLAMILRMENLSVISSQAWSSFVVS